jgi:hypothetical protein
VRAHAARALAPLRRHALRCAAVRRSLVRPTACGRASGGIRWPGGGGVGRWMRGTLERRTSCLTRVLRGLRTAARVGALSSSASVQVRARLAGRRRRRQRERARARQGVAAVGRERVPARAPAAHAYARGVRQVVHGAARVRHRRGTLSKDGGGVTI